MTRKLKAQRRVNRSLSSQERTRMVFERARREQLLSQRSRKALAGENNKESEEPGKPFEYTLNWEGQKNEKFFVPHLLKEGECPDITSEALRELVNITAEGKETPKSLKEKLMQESSDAIFNAVKRGIKGWHAYGKEQG